MKRRNSRGLTQSEATLQRGGLKNLTLREGTNFRVNKIEDLKWSLVWSLKKSEFKNEALTSLKHDYAQNNLLVYFILHWYIKKHDQDTKVT